MPYEIALVEKLLSGFKDLVRLLQEYPFVCVDNFDKC